jgi:hypothetical protein
MDTITQLRTDLTSLRMVVAIDSAMLLSVLRRMSPGLSIKTLFSEIDEQAIQAAQKRRDWWVGLVAELLTDEAIAQGAAPAADNTPTDSSP